MDQSYWSDQEVIKLSHHFVCARLSTYEDAAEAEFLKKHFRGRTGELENTVFLLLAPDGKTRLSRSGRSPQMVFGGTVGWESTVLALEMHAIAQKYPVKKEMTGLPPLPVSKDLRRSLNVAACDRQLLVIADRVPEKTLNTLQTIAWKKPYRGRLGWGVSKTDAEVQATGLAGKEPGILICRPDEFGLKATLIQQLPANASEAVVTKALTEALQTPRAPEKNYRRHMSRGQRLNKFWESEIEVSDPQTPPGRKPGRP
jgi:hypothetical protein